jgi:hypothetical protein
MERQALQIRREYRKSSNGGATDPHAQRVGHRLSLLRHSLMFFLSTLLNYLQVLSLHLLTSLISLPQIDVIDSHYTSLLTSLSSTTSYRFASQSHSSYISSLSRYGLLDNSLFQEYLTKIFFISLYAIIFTSLHYHTPSSPLAATAAATAMATGYREESHDNAFALPANLLKKLDHEENLSVDEDQYHHISYLREDDIQRLWESYHSVLAYLETMMRTGDTKDLFMRLHYNEAWKARVIQTNSQFLS